VTFAALAVDNFEGRVKDNLAQLLLRTARDLASECEKIEREQAGLDWPQKGWDAFKAWS
jgi:hypothetical protein